MYLAPNIEKVFVENKSKFDGYLTYDTITRRLGKAFDFPKDLKFKIERYGDLKEQEYTVSGLYDMTCDKKYVILNVSKHSNTLNLSGHTYDEFSFLVSQTIQHETIHQNQWQHRDYIEDVVKLDFRNVYGTLSEEREYLSDVDEIDAYAHDIAMEIRFYYPNKDPYTVLRAISRSRKIPSYNYYKRTFGRCDWSAIKKRLLNKTYKWMAYV